MCRTGKDEDDSQTRDRERVFSILGWGYAYHIYIYIYTLYKSFEPVAQLLYQKACITGNGEWFAMTGCPAKTALLAKYFSVFIHHRFLGFPLVKEDPSFE